MSAEARRWLTAAVREIDTPAGGTPAWNQKLTLQLLRREAEALLGVKEPAPAKGKQADVPAPASGERPTLKRPSP